MKVRTNQRVKQPIVYPIGPSPVELLNEHAQKRAEICAYVEDEEAGVVKAVLDIPADGEVDIPERAAETLISLGYAEAI